MEFVMVPVPEELLAEVENFLMAVGMRGRATQTAKGIDPELVTGLVRILNAECRAVLSVLAHATVARRPPTIAELATTLEWTDHETFGAVHELVELVWSSVGATISLKAGTDTVANAHGLDWADRKVFIGVDLATAVLASEAQLAT